MSWAGLEEDSPASPRLDRLSLKSESESTLGQPEDTTRSVVVSLLAATVQQDKQVSRLKVLPERSLSVGSGEASGGLVPG